MIINTVYVLQIPSNASESQYTVIVMGSGGLTFNQQTTVRTDFKTLSIFIQTDKAMYKPGKTGTLLLFINFV